MNSKIALLFFFTVVFSYDDEECKDVVDFCYVLDKHGKCGLAIAKRYCRRVCKHCTEPLLGPTEPTESCQDESSNCEQRFWVCATLPSDAAKCKLTCEHCKGLPGKSETALPTTPAPLPPPRPHIPGCEDKYHLCYMLDDANMCYLDITKVKCHHSCGHCQSKLTRMPDPTPECYDIDRNCDEEFYHCIEKGEKAHRCRQTCGLCAMQYRRNISSYGLEMGKKASAAANPQSKMESKAQD